MDVFDDGEQAEEAGWEFRDYAAMRLKRGLWRVSEECNRAAVLVSYWWD